MAGDNTLVFTDAAFDQDVLNSLEPVLVDFWAEWCGPCRMMAPTIDQIAAEYAGKAKVASWMWIRMCRLRVVTRFAASPLSWYSREARWSTKRSAPWGKRTSRRCSTLTSEPGRDEPVRHVPLLSSKVPP